MSRRHNKTGRNKSSLSSFIALERYLLNSAAWRDLTAMARAAYVEVAGGYDGANNGRIIFGSKTLGERLNTGKATAARALVELADHGFVECVKKGGFVCKVRHASEWRLTAFKCDVTGQLPLKPFMQWKPKIQNTVSPVRPYGIVGETVKAENGQKSPLRSHGRYRRGSFEGVHGITSETLLYSSHRQAATHSTPSADAGKPKAREQRDTSELKSLDNFQSLGGIALKSLAELQSQLHPDLQSWDATPSKQNLSRAA